MTRKCSSVSLLLQYCIGSVLLSSVLCEKILLLLSNDGLKTSHSQFIESFKGRNLDVDTKKISDKDLQIQSWGQWIYDGIVILSEGGPELGGAVDSAQLVQYVDDGGSIFMATDQNPSASARDIASQFGADFVEQGSIVEDYLSFDASEGESNIITNGIYPSSVVTGSPNSPILYAGGAFTTSPDSALAMRVLMPEHTAIVKSGGSILSGMDISLAVSMQSRANSRFSIVASTSMLSDSFFSAKTKDAVTNEVTSTGNRLFAESLLAWTLKLQGVLKYEKPQHHKMKETSPPVFNMYSVNDDIEVKVKILERWGDEWKPHVSKSVMAQYKMLSPYIQQPMEHVGDGKYSLSFKAPDVYGVFKWVVDYKKPGYSFLNFEEVMPVRPLRHDQYPRFIVQAYPYYFTLMSISAGFFMVVTGVMYA